MKKETLEIVRKSFVIEADCISQMLNHFDEKEFAHAVELLIAAPRIGTIGCGHSGIMCQHFSHLLCCIDKPSRFISPAEAVHGATGFLQKGDVCVFASRGGKTKELLPVIDICKKKGVAIIAITENMDSTIAKNANAVIKQFVTRELDRYSCQGTTSSTALCVIFQILQTAILEETDFPLENFALVHPGGAVGEKLNKKDN